MGTSPKTGGKGGGSPFEQTTTTGKKPVPTTAAEQTTTSEATTTTEAASYDENSPSADLDRVLTKNDVVAAISLVGDEGTDVSEYQKIDSDFASLFDICPGTSDVIPNGTLVGKEWKKPSGDVLLIVAGIDSDTLVDDDQNEILVDKFNNCKIDGDDDEGNSVYVSAFANKSYQDNSFSWDISARSYLVDGTTKKFATDGYSFRYGNVSVLVMRASIEDRYDQDVTDMARELRAELVMS